MTKETTKLLPRMAVVEAARKYLGHPWVWGGRGRGGTGLDCGGLWIVVLEDLGLQDLMPHYNITSDKRMMKFTDEEIRSLYGTVSKAWISIPKHEAGVGDCEMYFLRDRNVSCHCAILTDKGFIHTHEGVGEVVETARCRFWDKRVTGAFRFAGIED